MKLTTRGKRLVASLLLLLGFGLLFLDSLILAVAAFGAVFLFYDLVDSIRVSRGDSPAEFEPAGFDVRLFRGRSQQFRSRLKTSRSLLLDSTSMKWLKLGSSNIPEGEWPIDLNISGELAGMFSSDGISAAAISRYGLLSTRVVIALNIRLKVYPRFFASAIAALEFLMRSGAGSEGEVERNLLGLGLEYAETREYLPGDSLRRVDWKATARLSSLMIKHFYREGGGALHIIYPIDAPGPRTHDELATQLIDLVLSSAVRGSPISVTAYEKGTRLMSFTGSGRSVLASTLSLVFATTGTTYDDVYSVLDVVPISQERRALLLAHNKRLAELIQRAAKNGDFESDYRDLAVHLASLDIIPSFILLSSLVASRRLVAETIQELRGRRAGVTVVYPLRPWSDARNLEEAYLMARSQEQMLRFAETSGCNIAAIPFRLLPQAWVPFRKKRTSPLVNPPRS